MRARKIVNRRVSVHSAPGESPLVLKEGKRLSALVGGIATAGFCFVAIGFLRQAGTAEMQGPAGLVWTAMPYILAALAVISLAQMIPAALRSRETEITDDEVRVREGGLFGHRAWSAPLTDYDGVRWRRIRTHDGDSQEESRSLDIHVIELAHDDPDRCVPLRVERTRGDGPRAEWEGFVRQIGLPAIDARDGVQTVRAAEDVDKSVRELAREGKIDGGWDDRPSPETIEVTHLGEASEPDSQAIRITLHVPPVPRVIGYALYAVAGVFLISGLWDLDFGAVLFAVVFGGLPWLINWFGAQRPPQLTLTRQTVSYTDRMVDTRSFTLPSDEIESVHVARAPVGQVLGRPIHMNAGELVLSSDRGEKRIGNELSGAALVYLRDLVRSALANA